MELNASKTWRHGIGFTKTFFSVNTFLGSKILLAALFIYIRSDTVFETFYLTKLIF